MSAAPGRKRVAVLVSGRGTNLQALIDAARDPAYPAEIALVVSNRPGAQALQRAQAAHVEAQVIDHRQYRDRAGHEAAVIEAIEAGNIELICLAGYMRVLSPEFVHRYAGRLINIHPALLPAFRGTDTHARALAAGVRIHGASVHFVTEGVDEGPVIAQAAVPVHAGDNAERLAVRVLAAENRLYPLALALVARGQVRMSGAAAIAAGTPESGDDAVLFSPALVS